MIKSILVFDLFLQSHDQFIFYVREGNILTLATDTKYPYPAVVSSVWHPDDTWTDHPSSRLAPEKIVATTYGIKEMELASFLEIHAPKCMEHGMKNEMEEFNVFIPRRKMDDDLLQVGLFIRRAIGELHNVEVERHLNRLLQLKAFW